VRRVLKLPAYRRLLGAYTLNELAFSMGSVALALLVYRRTGSALGATAFFLCSQFFPALVAPMVVARLDRRAPREVLPALYALEGVVFLALAALAGRFSLAPVLGLALLDGIIALTARSLARTASVAVTSPAHLLREGNALANTSFSICFMVGPAIAGAVVAAGGTRIALLSNSGLFALIALTLLTASGLPGPTPDRSPARGRVRAALSHARERSGIRILLGLQAAALLFFTISIPVEVVFAQHTLHAGAGGYGGLLAAWGGGAIAGSGVYARWRGWSARALIGLGAASMGIGLLVMAMAPSLAVAIIGAAVAGVGNGVEAVSALTALQEQVEQLWMALMMGLHESISQIVPGAGILLGGAITALAGTRTALAVGGAGALAITAASWVVLRPGALLSEPSRDLARAQRV
jgi:predicted MFS family arabinose efflux permease